MINKMTLSVRFMFSKIYRWFLFFFETCGTMLTIFIFRLFPLIFLEKATRVLTG